MGCRVIEQKAENELTDIENKACYDYVLDYNKICLQTHNLCF